VIAHDDDGTTKTSRGAKSNATASSPVPITARPDPSTTLYTAPSCGEACTSGRDLLSKRGIPFSERDAQSNAQAQDALKKLIGGLEVPVLVVGASTLKGYEQAQWSEALDSAGYPKERLPGQAPTRGAMEPAAPAKADATTPDPK